MHRRHTWQHAYVHWATSLFGLVFRSVQNLDWAKVKPKTEVDLFCSDSVRTSDWTKDWAKDWANRLVWSSDWVQNSGVRLVFGLSEKTRRKTNPKSEVTQCTLRSFGLVGLELGGKKQYFDSFKRDRLFQAFGHLSQSRTLPCHRPHHF